MTPSSLNLSKRERQLVEALFRLGEASVAQVRRDLTAPPSYSAVRAMLNLLVGKGVVRFRRQGKRYVYRPVASKHKTGRAALRGIVRTFFGDQPADAVAALVDGCGGGLSGADLARIRRLIDEARADDA